MNTIPKRELQMSPSNPKKWWQWLLLYPALLTSVVASIPTFIDIVNATNMGVEWNQKKQATQSDTIWAKNPLCVLHIEPPTVTPFNIAVSATVCESGDILVKISLPTEQNNNYYKWIELQDVIDVQITSLDWLLNSVVADDNIVVASNSEVTALCHRFVQPGMLLRRVSIKGVGCYDELINTYTGAVISVKLVPCVEDCK